MFLCSQDVLLSRISGHLSLRRVLVCALAAAAVAAGQQPLVACDPALARALAELLADSAPAADQPPPPGAVTIPLCI